MSLVINHNMMAMNTARNLNNTYGRLSSSVERLSSGLRINSAADDAAGLAIRELMRADITTMQQGIRNAADAISMIQTADGGMAVIDEKLTRMKELAEQAATGTYTTLQREIINSEYQAMAAEIDRIATATNFNGVKLLDGSITNLHGGLGMKIHFGVGNSPGEDYYFINTGDVRATSTSGLRIGGDAKNDIWGQGAAGAAGLAGPGCCTAGYDSLDGPAGFKSGQTFSYGYNWDWTEDDDPDLLNGRYLAGRYTVTSSESLQDLINKVNEGTQSRVGIKLDSDSLAAAIKNMGTAAVCIGDEAYIFGSAAVAGGTTIIPAVSGVVNRTVATGTYVGEDFMFNIVNNTVGSGFALTQAQIKLLEDAGLDLSAMGLTSAMVSASGASLVNSAQAKTQLLARLAQAWNSLGLNNLSGLSITSGLTSGYSITSATLKASASSALLGTGLTATISAGETLKVHTGVYADSAGNWTDNKRIASALGLDEVIIEIKNQNKEEFRAFVSAGNGNVLKSSVYQVFIDAKGSAHVISAATLNTGTASLLTKLAFPVSSASVTVPPQIADSEASAQSAFLKAVQDSWLATFTNMVGLSFVSAAPGATLGAKITGQNISDSNNATALDGTPGPTATIKDGSNITVHTGVWVDSAGNFTTDQDVVNLFSAGYFQEMIYHVGNAAGTGPLTVSLSGQTMAAAITPNSASTLADLSAALTGSLIATITARQVVGGNQGEISIYPTHPTNPHVPQTWAELVEVGADSKTIPVPSTLSTTITVDGVSSAISTGDLATLPKTATLADLVTAVNNGLSAYLGVLNTAGNAAGLTGLGRIVTSLAAPPSGPTGMSQVLDPTVDESFYSGTLDRSVATGSYDNSGDVYNSTKGYALTSAQKAILEDAGLDLTTLSLVSAIVATSASSTVSSAEARANLLVKLNQLWSALNMANMSAISVSVGTADAFNLLTVSATTASAANGVFAGVGAGATVNERQKFVVHTGVYADANGNWTDDKALASALGLQEIVYTVENNNYTPVKASAGFSTNAWWTASGDFTFDLNNKTLMSAAGLNIAELTSTNISLSASAATSAAAIAKLYTSAQSLWNAKYGLMDQVVFRKDDIGTTIQAMTPAQIVLSDPGNAAVTEGNGDTDEILSGKTLIVNTGIYIDGSGNWTDDALLASAFGLSAVVYTVIRGTGTGSPGSPSSGEYRVTIEYGGISFTPSGTQMFTNGIITKSGLQELATDINVSIKELIAAKHTGNPSGQVFRSGQIAPPAPTMAQLEAVATYRNLPTINTNAAASLNNLDITATLAGSPVAVAFAPQPSNLTMGALTNMLNADITQILSTAQTLATNNSGLLPGQLLKVGASVHDGPATEASIDELEWEDIYKAASGPQTITTTGIIDKTKYVTLVASAGTDYANASGISNFGAWALASAINHNANSQFWAMVQPYDSQGHSADMVYVFTKKGGDFNSLLACDVADGDIASRDAINAIEFENVAGNSISQSGTSFTLGGENWGTFKPVQTRAGMGKEVWNLTINGRDVGKERDLWIAAVTDGKNEISTPGLDSGIINGLDRHSFVEIQNADNGPWAGAEVRTQSSAQEALDAVNGAMERKDKVRADIGALQNRLENTITNLEIQMEALQASESRISDVDVATEMTEFVRNQVLAQAAVSMLSQANSLPQMALSLLNA